MCIRYLGFLLLVWFPGALHARPCAAPTLERGYFVPEPETTNPERTELRYACDKGFKPAVEGWWATITCQNGEWSHKPQCVDERACFPPTIPNAQVTESITGWYEDGQGIRIKCDDGYEPEDVRRVTTTCTNRTWSPELRCNRSDDACGVPPQIPHAVIIQGYKEVFAVDAKVTYECEDGYAVEGGDTQKSIYCIGGRWDEPPTCRSVRACGEPPLVPHSHITAGLERQFDPEAELTYTCDDGYTVEGNSRTITIYCISGTWNENPECSKEISTDQGGAAGPDRGHSTTLGSQGPPAGRGIPPGTGQGGSSAERTDGRPTPGDGGVQSGRGDRGGSGQDGGGRTGPETGTGSRPGTGHGGGSSGSTARPAGGGSSTTSGSDGREHKPLITHISHCGAHPVVDNGVVVEDERMFLKYKCAAFYKLVGSETVTCYNDGTWSPLPACEEAFCVLKPGEYVGGHLRLSTTEYFTEGETKIIHCFNGYYGSYSTIAQCTNGEITLSSCCYHRDRRYCY